MKTTEKQLLLNPAGVDEASELIGTWLKDIGITGRDALRIRLTMEELLLRISSHFAAGISGTLTLGKRFGTSFIRFRYAGESFDPVTASDDEMSLLTGRILTNMGLSPSWSYRMGRNELMQRVSEPQLSSQLMLAGALVLAFVLGIGGTVIPAEVRDILAFFVLQPISDIFTRLLHVFIGPMIFLSVLSGICGIGNASDFGRIGKKILTRFIRSTFLITALAILTRPFFRLPAVSSAGGESQLLKIRELLLGMVPGNPVAPFYEGNTLQIIFLAVLIGIILLGLSERSRHVQDLLTELNDIVAQGVGIVCRMLPAFIFASLTLQFWENGLGTIFSLWKPLVAGLVLIFICMTAKLLYSASKLKVRAIDLIRKILPGVVVGFATASSSAAYGTCTDICEKKLGIAEALVRIGIPFSSVFHCGGLGILFVLCAFAVSQTYGMGGGFSWLFVIWLVSGILSLAVPPVSGACLACMGILFSQLSLPAEGLGAAGVLILILEFFATGFDIGMRMMDIALLADDLGMLDHEVLRKQENA